MWVSLAEKGWSPAFSAPLHQAGGCWGNSGSPGHACSLVLKDSFECTCSWRFGVSWASSKWPLAVLQTDGAAHLLFWTCSCWPSTEPWQPGTPLNRIREAAFAGGTGPQGLLLIQRRESLFLMGMVLSNSAARKKNLICRYELFNQVWEWRGCGIFFLGGGEFWGYGNIHLYISSAELSPTAPFI